MPDVVVMQENITAQASLNTGISGCSSRRKGAKRCVTSLAFSLSPAALYARKGLSEGDVCHQVGGAVDSSKQFLQRHHSLDRIASLKSATLSSRDSSPGIHHPCHNLESFISMGEWGVSLCVD